MDIAYANVGPDVDSPLLPEINTEINSCFHKDEFM